MISDILKGKTQEEIDQAIYKKEPHEIMWLGIEHNKPEYVKYAIDKNENIDDDTLEQMADLSIWDDTVNYYLNKLEKTNVFNAIRKSFVAKKDKTYILNLLNKIQDFSKIVVRDITIATSILKLCILYSNNLDIIKAVYNYPKLKINLIYQYKKDFVEKLINNEDLIDDPLELLLGNKIVKESIEHILKPKSKEEIDEIQLYILRVLEYLFKEYPKDDTMPFYIIQRNYNTLKTNLEKGIPAKETALELKLKY